MLVATMLVHLILVGALMRSCVPQCLSDQTSLQEIIVVCARCQFGWLYIQQASLPLVMLPEEHPHLVTTLSVENAYK